MRGIEEEQSGIGWDQREHTSDEESGSVHRKRFAARKDGELGPIERFFNGPWTKLTRVARWPLVVLGVVLFGVSIWLATLLEIPVESERFLPENHPLILASDLFTKGFPSFDVFENVAIRAIWGLSGIDRSKTNKYVPDDLGEPVFNTSFSLLSKVAQQLILEACDFFSDPAKEFVTNSSTIENKVDCLPRDYLQWRKDSNLGGFQDFPNEQTLATDLLKFGNATVNGTRPYLKYLTRQKLV